MRKVWKSWWRIRATTPGTRWSRRGSSRYGPTSPNLIADARNGRASGSSRRRSTRIGSGSVAIEASSAETAWRADRADVRARLRDRRFATLVRAREAKRAEEAAVTSSGMQPSAAAQDDDRRGDAASVAGRGDKFTYCSLAACLSL